jgi:hypothetical protein
MLSLMLVSFSQGISTGRIIENLDEHFRVPASSERGSFLRRLGRGGEFTRYLKSVRWANKPQQNLMRVPEATK